MATIDEGYEWLRLRLKARHYSLDYYNHESDKPEPMYDGTYVVQNDTLVLVRDKGSPIKYRISRHRSTKPRSTIDIYALTLNAGGDGTAGHSRILSGGQPLVEEDGK